MGILIVITLILVGLSLVFIVATYFTFKTQTSPFQKQFLAGSVPDKLPEGLYRGNVPGHTFTWQGKKFGKDGSGINVFKNDGKLSDKYPFKFYKSKGLQDDISVIKIDYNLSENPIWLRFIVDEFVQTSPNKYLGKLHVQIFPGLSAALGYFKLEK